MNLPNKPKILAATFNPVSRTKMISFLVDFPKFKTWLVKEYGEEVKQYEKFAIEST